MTSTNEENKQNNSIVEHASASDVVSSSRRMRQNQINQLAASASNNDIVASPAVHVNPDVVVEISERSDTKGDADGDERDTMKDQGPSAIRN